MEEGYQSELNYLNFIDYIFSCGFPDSLAKFFLYIDSFFKRREQIIICSYSPSKELRILNDRSVNASILHQLVSSNSFREGESTWEGHRLTIYLIGKEKKQNFYIAMVDPTGDYQQLLSYIRLFFLETKSLERRLMMAINLIYIDDITGLFNQRKLYLDIKEAIAQYAITKDHFVIVFIDIDHFKRVNDHYGHLVGTDLLKQVARRIKLLLRDDDLLYRYGGDEFILLLKRVNIEQTYAICQRILADIKDTIFISEVAKQRNSFRISVSIGMAEYPTNTSNFDEIVALADRMMYQAKNSGRGKICVPSQML